MKIDGREWRLVPVEPTEDMKTAVAPLIGQYREAGKRYAEAAYRAMIANAPTPPALGDDCDDVDAILRIVGLDPGRCRTEGGMLNVGRVRTLWEDVVSLAAQASGQAAPSDEEIETLARDYCDDPTVGAIVFTSTRDCVDFARTLLQRYGQAPAASPDFPHYEMAFICRVLEADHPEKADLDTALGMARSVRVALLKERAAQAPAASAEPVAWLVDWPDEPELGHYLTESPGDIDSGRRRALVFRDAAPVAASAEPQSIGYIDYKGNHGHARAVLTRGMDEQGNDWADGTKIYAAPVAAQASAVVNQQLTTEQAPAANGDAPTARELDMAMLVKRLARAVASDPALHGIALDALRRWGMLGSPLREGGE